MEACGKNFAYLSNEWTAIFGVTNTAIALVAFTGNLVAFLVILKTKCLQSLSTCFLGSLIVADFLIGTLLEPMHVAQLISKSFRNNCTLTYARRYLSTLLLIASVNSIALISYDRYLHLTRTKDYGQLMNKRRVTVLISVGWAIPTAVLMINLPGKNNPIVVGIRFLCVSLTFVATVVFYTRIMKVVRKKEKEMADSQAQDQMQQPRMNNNIRAAKAIATIIVCFVVTIIPSATYFCVVTIRGFTSNGIPGLNETSIDVYYTVVKTLAMANSGINPLIYYLRHPKFKKSLVKHSRGFCPIRSRTDRLSCENERRDASSPQTFVT